MFLFNITFWNRLFHFYDIALVFKVLNVFIYIIVLKSIWVFHITSLLCFIEVLISLNYFNTFDSGLTSALRAICGSLGIARDVWNRNLMSPFWRRSVSRVQIYAIIWYLPWLTSIANILWIEVAQRSLPAKIRMIVLRFSFPFVLCQLLFKLYLFTLFEYLLWPHDIPL